jgi:xanthine dehydrogenase/oxidase
MSIAVGEPPMCLSCSAMFAVKRAIEDARKDAGNEDLFQLCK